MGGSPYMPANKASGNSCKCSALVSVKRGIPTSYECQLTLCFSTLHECGLVTHTKLAPRWVLIQVKFNPVQNMGSL